MERERAVGRQAEPSMPRDSMPWKVPMPLTPGDSMPTDTTYAIT